MTPAQFNTGNPVGDIGDFPQAISGISPCDMGNFLMRDLGFPHARFSRSNVAETPSDLVALWPRRIQGRRADATKGESHCERPRMHARPPRRNMTRAWLPKCFGWFVVAGFPGRLICSVAAGNEFEGLLAHDRRVILFQPKPFDRRGNFTKFRGSGRLDQVRIGPQLIRLLNIGFEAR